MHQNRPPARDAIDLGIHPITGASAYCSVCQSPDHSLKDCPSLDSAMAYRGSASAKVAALGQGSTSDGRQLPSEEQLLLGLHGRLIRAKGPQSRAAQLLKNRQHQLSLQPPLPQSLEVAGGVPPTGGSGDMGRRLQPSSHVSQAVPAPYGGRALPGNCYRCNLPGHWASQCPTSGGRWQQQPVKAPTRDSTSTEMRLSDLSPMGKPMLLSSQSSTSMPQGTGHLEDSSETNSSLEG